MRDSLGQCFDGIDEVYIHEGWEKKSNCLVFLAGRGQSGRLLAHWYAEHGDWNDTFFVGVTPEEYCWYPMPIGPHDQAEAVEGLSAARATIEELLDYLEEYTGIPRNRTIIAGFSAGGVMAIEVASRSDQPFRAAVCHAGAILEPDLLPPAPNHTPILLTHNSDDDCFEWKERYWPMKRALIDQGYNLFVIERFIGGHELIADDSIQVSNFHNLQSSSFEQV